MNETCRFPRIATRFGGMIAVLLALSLLVLAGPWAVGADSNSVGPVAPLAFNRDIRPILVDSCFPCHGPDSQARKAELRLDIRVEALREREGIRPIVPGNSGESALVQRITHADVAERMPPEDSERTITATEIELLRRWIDEGAPYEPHWAYIAPVRAELPQAQPGTQPVNAVDRFIGAALARAGLKPSGPAAPATLARRVSFDLTGLPPSPEDIQAFLPDPSGAAYEESVDRLLASPRFGERMAVHWLDLVRYADSNGYHSDEYRSIYPYRDYVINAFNTNKPYDEFTVEQLAGDLLPNPTLKQRIAAGYNRLNQITAEGGAQAKEYLAKYTSDRIRTTSAIWLGATMGCAECHEHKFDPYATKDFYSMGAFFADIDEVGVYPGSSRWLPVIPLPTEDEAEREHALESRLDKLNGTLENPGLYLALAQHDWERRSRQQHKLFGPPDWMSVTPRSFRSEGGAALELLDDGSILSTGLNPESEEYVIVVRSDRPAVTGLRLEALGHESFESAFTRTGTFFVLSEIEVFASTEQKRGLAQATWPRGLDPLSQGEDLSVSLTESSHREQRIPISKAEASFDTPTNSVARAIDGESTTGWLVRSGKKQGGSAVAVFTFAKPVIVGPETTLTVHLKQVSAVVRTSMGRVRLSLTGSAEPRFHTTASISEANLGTLLKKDGERTPHERASLAAYYRRIAPELDSVRADIASTRIELDEHRSSFATTLQTLAVEPRLMRVLPRGNWMDETGEVVEPQVPAFLPPLGVEGRRANRLDFARWLVRADNPLTARVFVNRLWSMFFGTGISKVLDDLGAQGEWPTHPELLDWLAVEFRESGWDVKHLVKLLVMSNTYKQASLRRKDLDEADPYNRLLARQTPRRLEAEMVRDNALAISGLLAEKIGGPSVKPYQPEGYWQHLFFPARTYVHDRGDDQHRRGLYTHWQRSFLHPSLLAFDAPSREECTAERNVSNTPLQALVLLNDPTYVEASRAFARLILRDGGHDLNDRLDFAFRTALSRPPSLRESSLLRNLYESHLETFQKDPDSAAAGFEQRADLPEDDTELAQWAAWTSVARAIFNLHEFITRS